MDQAEIAQRGPYAFDLEKGRRYAWCACGQSQKQPLCDGSHKPTRFVPVVHEAAESGRVWLCGCKRTATPPFCDGSHNRL